MAAPNTLPLPMPVTMPPMMISQNARDWIDFPLHFLSPLTPL